MSEDGYTRITLRIPDRLHARLSEVAAQTSKSMNAEIIGRLEESFVGDGRKVVFTPDTMSLLLRSRLESLKAMISTLQEEIAAADFDPNVAEGARDELESMQEFATTIRQALFYAVQAKYSGTPIPAEVEHLASDLAQMPF